MRVAGNRMLIATLKVLLSDGSRWELGTDEAWRVNRGAVGYDSVFNGERREGGLTQRGEGDGWPAISVSVRPEPL